MTTQAVVQKTPSAWHSSRRWSDSSAQPRKLPEYLEAHEVEVIIRATDNPRAKLLMIGQWRAGLRIPEALALEGSPTSHSMPSRRSLRVPAGKSNRSEDRANAPLAAGGAYDRHVAHGSIDQGKLVDVHLSTAWRWVKAAVRRAEELGAVVSGRKVGAHTLRHSYARNLLMNGIQINYLITLARTLIDPDHAHLPGARAGPVGES